jgi:hypothetical protein
LAEAAGSVSTEDVSDPASDGGFETSPRFSSKFHSAFCIVVDDDDDDDDDDRRSHAECERTICRRDDEEDLFMRVSENLDDP